MTKMKGSGYEGLWWCDDCKAGRRHGAWLLGCTQTRGYMTRGHEVTRSRGHVTRDTLLLALANLRRVRGARLRRGHGGHQAGLLGAGAGVVAGVVAGVPRAVAGAVRGVAAHAAVLLPVLVLAEGAAVARQAAARAGLARSTAAVPTRLGANTVTVWHIYV